MKVGVLGLWHLGCVTSACLAKLGYQVIGFDQDHTVIDNLRLVKAPISEPGLDELIKINLDSKRLQFTTNVEDTIRNSSYVLLTIDTPVDDKDRVDLTSVYDAINDIAKFAEDNITIIVQSQVPVGTCDDFIKIIRGKRPELKFGLGYCPENLRLGKAIEIFEKPDRIIIGANDEDTTNKIEAFFNVINCPKIKMDLKSAEMTKHAINAFLATCISFINWIGNVCDEVGADSKKVSEGLMSESRIGRNLPLRAGLGFSGGTLGRDLRILTKLGQDLDIQPDLIESVLKTNHEQNIKVIKKLLKIFSSLEGLTIGILGLTYKAGTNTLRRSTALEIIEELLHLKTTVNAYDPAISYVDSITNEKFRLLDSAYSVAEDSNALLIFTEWPEFKKLDYRKIHAKMKNPIVIDMKNFLDGNILENLGFKYNRS